MTTADQPLELYRLDLGAVLLGLGAAGASCLGPMAEVDGLLVDLRMMPRKVQEMAFAKGIIPYIPADGQDRS